MELAPLSPADIPEVMRLERSPGYDAFIGQWDAEAHAAEIVSPDARYLGFRSHAGLAGFAILQNFREPVVRLRRIAVGEPGRGVGTRLLRAVLDWVFAETPAEAMRLDVEKQNRRAQRVYLREGWLLDGDDGERHLLMRIPRERWAALRQAPRAAW